MHIERILNDAGTARWVLTPTERTESQMPASSATTNEASEEDVVALAASPQVRGRWSCEAPPDNLPRRMRPVVDALLDVVDGIKSSEISLATSPQPVAAGHAQRFPGCCFPFPTLCV